MKTLADSKTLKGGGEVVRRQPDGWIFESTGYSEYYQAMVQGANKGGQCFYSNETLKKYGINPNADFF